MGFREALTDLSDLSEEETEEESLKVLNQTLHQLEGVLQQPPEILQRRQEINEMLFRAALQRQTEATRLPTSTDSVTQHRASRVGVEHLASSSSPDAQTRRQSQPRVGARGSVLGISPDSPPELSGTLAVQVRSHATHDRSAVRVVLRLQGGQELSIDDVQNLFQTERRTPTTAQTRRVSRTTPTPSRENPLGGTRPPASRPTPTRGLSRADAAGCRTACTPRRTA